MPTPEQTEIPGTEPPRIEEIERAARNFQVAKDESTAAKEKETTKKDHLIACMLDRCVEVYRLRDGSLVRVTDKKDVKIEKSKQPKRENTEKP